MTEQDVPRFTGEGPGAAPAPGRTGGLWLRALNDGRRAYAILALLFAYAVFQRLGQTINNDVAWYIYSANALLDGGRLYDDIFFEVNPPLMLYHTVPPVLLARWSGLFPVDVYYLYIFAVIGLSLALSGRILALVAPAMPAAYRRGLLLALFLAVAIGPAGDFGQREHLMLTLALPYFLLLALRAGGAGVGRRLALPVGVLAGLGFAIKPHFLLLPVLLELYLLCQRRKPALAFRGETLALAGTVLLYLLAILLFTPEYPAKVVPYALEVYNQTISNALAFVLRRWETLLLPGVAALFLFQRRRLRYRHLADVLVLGAIGFYAIYVVQMKGWNYHIYPTTAMLLLSFVVLFADHLHTVLQTTSAGATPLRRQLVGLAALAVAAFLVARPLANPGNNNPLFPLLAPFVEAHGPDSSVYFFSSNTWTAWPMVLYTEAHWASRFAHQWLVPGLEWHRRKNGGGEQAKDGELLVEIEDFVRESLIADLSKRPPVLIFLDARPVKSWYVGYEFDFIDYFSADPRFVEIWSHYELVRDFEGFQVYRRCRGDCVKEG